MQVPSRGFLIPKDSIIIKNMSLITYLKDTQGELKHVSWPSAKQSFAFTVVVVLLSVFVAFYLGFFDKVFSLILEKFVS
ncbi:MAG: preprotein translocase subunit SecE [Parcubacteria group bacterium]